MSSKDNIDIKRNIKLSNKIIDGTEKIASKTKNKFNELFNRSINLTIKYNNSKTPFKASSLVSQDIDNQLKKIINDVNKDYKQFLSATEKYLIDGYELHLSKADLASISKKYSVIIENLVSNTNILKRDITSLLTQNLSRGVSEKKLVLGLKELYPAYSRNASTLINTGLQRIFVDSTVTKFNQLGFNWYIWAGPLDSLTRDEPCRRLVWHKFSSSQLDRYTALRLSLWNCRHNIIPILDSQINEYPTIE